MIDFKITVPHNEAEDWHQWYFPGAYRGNQVVESRDKGGRLQGSREGFYPSWFVLKCNNPECGGRAAVPTSVVTDLADKRDPAVSA